MKLYVLVIKGKRLEMLFQCWLQMSRNHIITTNIFKRNRTCLIPLKVFFPAPKSRVTPVAVINHVICSSNKALSCTLFSRSNYDSKFQHSACVKFRGPPDLVGQSRSVQTSIPRNRQLVPRLVLTNTLFKTSGAESGCSQPVPRRLSNQVNSSLSYT